MLVEQCFRKICGNERQAAEKKQKIDSLLFEREQLREHQIFSHLNVSKAPIVDFIEGDRSRAVILAELS